MKNGRSSSSSSGTMVRETKPNLDQYRSPSMWEKLETWKADKLKRQNGSKAKAQQPFKAGASKEVTRKVPCKASEKIKLLSESNQRTTWSYHTSPRHLNYRKSMPASLKVRRTAGKETANHGKENMRRSVIKKSAKKAHREIQTQAVVESVGVSAVTGRSKTGVKQPTAQSSTRLPMQGELTLVDVRNVQKKTARNQKKRKVFLEEEDDDDEEFELKSALKVPRTAIETKGRKSGTLKPRKSVANNFESNITRGGPKSGMAQKRRSMRLSDTGLSAEDDPINRGGNTTPMGLAATPRPSSRMNAQEDTRTVGEAEDSSSHGLPANRRSEDAGQMKRRQELEQWLISKGRTPRRTATFLKTPRVAPEKARRKTVGGRSDPINSQLTVEEAMDACRNMLREGCPAEYLSGWLERLQEKLPCLTNMTAFVECRAEVQNRLHMKLNMETVVEDVPSVAGYEADVTMSTKRRRRSSYQLLSPVGEDSSALRYQVREATPYFKRIQEALGNQTSTPSTMIVTPVRRSIRLSKRKSVTFANYQPESDRCVDTLSELEGQNSEPPVQLIIRPNRALEGEFDLAEEG